MGLVPRNVTSVLSGVMLDVDCFFFLGGASGREDGGPMMTWSAAGVTLVTLTVVTGVDGVTGVVCVVTTVTLVLGPTTPGAGLVLDTMSGTTAACLTSLTLDL